MYLAIIIFTQPNSTELIREGLVRSFDTLEEAKEFAVNLLTENSGPEGSTVSTTIIKQIELS
jgi:hypothetical protein